MKKLIIIAAAMLLSFAASAQDGKSIYNKYSDSKDVSAVYISPAMFRLMGKLPEMDFGGEDVNISGIVKSLKGFYLIDSENPAINTRLSDEADKLVKNGKYEMLMEVKDDGEHVNIYTLGNDKVIDSFIFIAKDSDECTFISLDGQIPREEFEKLIASAISD